MNKVEKNVEKFFHEVDQELEIGSFKKTKNKKRAFFTFDDIFILFFEDSYVLISEGDNDDEDKDKIYININQCANFINRLVLYRKSGGSLKLKELKEKL